MRIQQERLLDGAWIRLTGCGEDTRAELVGAGHRHRATRAISLATAAHLARRGTPVVQRPTSEGSAS